MILNRSVNDDDENRPITARILETTADKTNEKLTIDLGKFTLSKLKWKNRTFEETLEEWKVVCHKGEANIGENVSDEKYDELVKEMKDQKKEQADGKKGNKER